MFQLVGLIVMLIIPFLVYAYGQKDKARQAAKKVKAAAVLNEKLDARNAVAAQ